MSSFNIAFWNLQNLFDTSLSEIAADFGFTPANGWTDQAKATKISNLATIINGMFDGDGPDILGICEIENKNIANELITALNRSDLVLAHVDSPDIRGIDCSLIYSEDKFELEGIPIEHLVHLRYPTRDIFEVRLKVKANDSELIVLINHWPSRSRGRRETEPYRITVASHCGKIVDEHLKWPRSQYIAAADTADTLDKLNAQWNRNILIMGDFNDEPYDRSILDELQASKGYDKIEENLKKSSGRDHTPSVSSYLRKQAYLFNCSWTVGSRPDSGSYYFSGSTNTMNMLDQIIISRGLLYGESGLRINQNANSEPNFEIYAPLQMRTSSSNVRPKRFQFRKNDDGTFWNNNGFSDHFPVIASIDIL